MKKIALLGLFAATCSFAASPAKTTISNEDAAALYNALNSVKDGLSPANVGAAAGDIWILKGVAEDVGVQDNRRQVAITRANVSKDMATGVEKALADWDAFRVAVVPLELIPLTPFTDQEIRDAKITPALLAPIQHYLFPK